MGHVWEGLDPHKYLTDTFGVEKMARVLSRDIFKRLKGTTAEGVLKDYVNSADDNNRMTTLDLLTLALIGDLKYEGIYTQEMLLEFSNRFVRTYVHINLDLEYGISKGALTQRQSELIAEYRLNRESKVE